MTRRFLRYASIAGALVGAGLPGGARGAEAGGDVYAVLKAPLPPTRGRCATSRVDAAHVRAPLGSPDTDGCVVARIEGEVVPLRELAEALVASHEAGPRGASGSGLSKNLERTLGRIVELRLLVQEARDMGFGEFPELKEAVEAFAATDLRSRLERQATASVKPDEAEVRQLHQDAVREWQLRSLLFARREDAEAFRARVDRGEPFELAGAQAVAARQAQGTPEADWVRSSSVVPQIRQALVRANAGVVLGAGLTGASTPPVEVKDGFVVARVDAVRYPESRESMQEARAASLERRREEALRAFHAALVKRHAIVDRALLERIDLEAKEPGLEALRRDRRALARVRGSAPITVADLTAAVEKKFFHGMERPIEEKRVNAQKQPVFDQLLRSRVIVREAKARNLARTRAHREAVEEYRRGVLFSAMLEKVIVPDVKVTEEQARRYYEEHRADFTQPQMYRLEGITFDSAKRAQGALEKLRGGSDLAWMRANADGQLKPDESKVPLDARTVSTTGLPVGLVKALAGARRGDYRLWSEGAQHHVVRVADEFPPSVQPYAQAREAVAKKLLADGVAKAVHDYAEKLRAARKVEVFLARVES